MSSPGGKYSCVEVDRISHLPDSVLCHILSFLDTEIAVRTCVLSKRWKSVFTFVPRICFYRRLFSTEELRIANKESVFKNSVSMSLLKNRCESLNSFSLQYSERAIERSPFHGWIGTVMMKNVSFLDLDRSSLFIINLPYCIFTGSSLKTLRLQGDFLVQTPPSPGSVFLPRLECLSLSKVKYGNSESVRKLIGVCPVLKSLYVRRDGYDNVTVFTVSSDTLERLEILAVGFYSVPKNDRDMMKLEIKAPFLKYLRLCDYESRNFSIGTLPSLDELHLFDVDFDLDLLDPYDELSFSDWGLGFLDVIVLENLKIVSIGMEEVVDVVAGSNKVFPAMTILILTSYWKWKTLLQLLGKTENLQVLKLRKHCVEFDEAEEEEVPPACFSSSVERISLISWSTKPGDYIKFELNSLVGMIKYFLKHGKILQEFDISYTYLNLIDRYLSPDEEEEEEGNIQMYSRDVLLEFTRKSSFCKICVVYK